MSEEKKGAKPIDPPVKKINLGRVITTLNGEKIEKTNPTKKELEALPFKKDKDGECVKNAVGNKLLDTSKLPDETVKDVIFNCLERYQLEEKQPRKILWKLGRVANFFAGKEGEIEFNIKEKDKKFLVEVLTENIMREEKSSDEKKKEQTKKGYYASYIIGQVFDELGYTEDDDEEA